MKSVRRTAFAFAAGSAIFWMFASIVQYQGFLPIFDTPNAPDAWIVGIIGVLPLVIYSLICLYTFRWLQRELTRLIRAEHENRDT